MKTFHVSISLKGLLSSRRAIVGLRDSSGRKLSDADARSRLVDLLAEGVLQMPIGEACEGFSTVTGCPGHDDRSAS